MALDDRDPDGAGYALGRQELEARIANVLAACPELRPDSTRARLLRLAEKWTGDRIHLPDIPYAFQWFVEFVETCAESEAGVAAAVRAATGIGVERTVADTLKRLGDEWEASAVMAGLPGDLGRGLHADLAAVDRRATMKVFRAAADHLSQLPPVHCRTGWDVFVHLAGRNSRGGLPPDMVFLESALDWLTPRVRVGVERWNNRRAAALMATQQLNEARMRRQPHAGRTNDAIHVVILIEGDDNVPGVWYLSWWGQWTSDPDVLEPGHWRIPVEGDGLPALAAEVMDEVEMRLEDRMDDVVVEFVLPYELLNLPVEWWSRGEWSHRGRSHSLGTHYPIVLRSLERLREPAWGRQWRQRWHRLLVAPDRASVMWCHLEGPDLDSHLDKLDSSLGGDENLVATVLSAPPDRARDPDRETGLRELEIALSRGVPIVVWHRAEPLAGQVAEAIREFLGSDDLHDLGRRAHRLRLDRMLLKPGEAREAHLGSHLAVLVDDPDRRPGRGPDESRERDSR